MQRYTSLKRSNKQWTILFNGFWIFYMNINNFFVCWAYYVIVGPNDVAIWEVVFGKFKEIFIDFDSSTTTICVCLVSHFLIMIKGHVWYTDHKLYHKLFVTQTERSKKKPVMNSMIMNSITYAKYLKPTCVYFHQLIKLI